MKYSLPLVLLVLAALVPALAAPAQAGEVTAVAVDRSSIAFVVREMNVPVDGKFHTFTAQVSFDPAKPEAAKVSIDIDVASIDAGNPEANDEVVGKDWLDAKAYPQAHFVSGAFKALGGNRYEVSGRITIKGRTHDVSAPFTFTPQGSGGTFDGAFLLKRADFAVGEGSWSDFSAVANEIQVRFHFIGSGK